MWRYQFYSKDKLRYFTVENVIEGAAISGPPKGVLRAKLSITITRVYTEIYRNQSNTTIILYTYKLKFLSQHGDWFRFSTWTGGLVPLTWTSSRFDNCIVCDNVISRFEIQFNKERTLVVKSCLKRNNA